MELTTNKLVEHVKKRKPHSEETRKKQSAGVLAAYAAGKIRRPYDAERYRKSGEKNRGRTHTPEVRERLRIANLGKKQSPETLAKLSAIRKGRKLSPEKRANVLAALEAGRKIPFTEERRKKISARLKGVKRSKEGREAHSKRMKEMYKDGRINISSEAIAARAAKLRRRPQIDPKIMKGPTNMHSKSGVLRSPMNVEYPFHNLTHFVREHPELFLPEDVVWRERIYRHGVRGERVGYICRAASGLGTVVSGGRGTWKGWTLVSDIERDMNGGRDLLKRDEATIVSP